METNIELEPDNHAAKADGLTAEMKARLGSIDPTVPHALFLTTKQVSDITGMKVPTLKQWRADGEGPLWRKFGRSVRYPYRDLLKWAEAQ